MSINHQISLSISSTNSTPSLQGYDNETGNTEPGGLFNFAANSVNSAFTLALTVANMQDVWLWSDKGGTIRTNGNNAADVQTLTVTGTPTGGSIPITFNGSVTSIPYNSNASTAQSALTNMASIGAGNVTVTNGPLPGTALVFTFNGTLNAGQQPLMVTSNAGLTGGTTPTAAVTHTTPGLPSNTIVLIPGIPLFWGASMGYGSNPFTVNVTNASFSCTAAAQLKIRCLSE